MNDTVPPTMAEPIAATPVVVLVEVEGEPLALLLPPPHATSAAHKTAPSATFVIGVLSLLFFTTCFPLLVVIGYE
ncbi:hypothetical protein [Paraburkholderia heleia]|uniref:hypothetical protein n=1 Tax=Paraburkholderia heleia TaxID=634127 RepID=UPI002AB6CBBB|nr:hypothetical protein [Paraburkholderia heleia]